MTSAAADRPLRRRSRRQPDLHQERCGSPFRPRVLGSRATLTAADDVDGRGVVGRRLSLRLGLSRPFRLQFRGRAHGNRSPLGLGSSGPALSSSSSSSRSLSAFQARSSSRWRARRASSASISLTVNLGRRRGFDPAESLFDCSHPLVEAVVVLLHLVVQKLAQAVDAASRISVSTLPMRFTSSVASSPHEDQRRGDDDLRVLHSSARLYASLRLLATPWVLLAHSPSAASLCPCCCGWGLLPAPAATAGRWRPCRAARSQARPK